MKYKVTFEVEVEANDVMEAEELARIEVSEEAVEATVYLLTPRKR